MPYLGTRNLWPSTRNTRDCVKPASPHDKSFRKCYDAALAKLQIAISKFQREAKNNPHLEERRKLAESLLTHWKIYHF